MAAAAEEEEEEEDDDGAMCLVMGTRLMNCAWMAAASSAADGAGLDVNAVPFECEGTVSRR